MLLYILILIIIVICAIVVYQLHNIRLLFHQSLFHLQSLDFELFHIAQELNPNYGFCSKCGRRTIVSHVTLSEHEQDSNVPDVFYCNNCWWLSDNVFKIIDDENDLTPKK